MAFAVGRKPHIYADGDRVFIDIGDGVFEASILVATNVEARLPGPGGQITLQFHRFFIHSDKSLDDITKDIASKLPVLELFDVINGKLTERENVQ